MSQLMQSLYGLKWNPFTRNIPIEGIMYPEKWDQFFWRVENLVMDGGFASIIGDPGLGKSIMMRALYERLTKLKDVQVQMLDRPQSGVADFYREVGSLFGVELKPSNRWAGYSKLREKWKEHISASLFRPILMIDEAQEMLPAVLSELRLISSQKFDSNLLLTVVFAGDMRFAEKMKSQDLIPLGTRIIKMQFEPYSKEDLVQMLNETMKKAGCEHLMKAELVSTLAEHSLQNPRIMMQQSSELLKLAMKKDAKQLDINLYFELYPPPLPRGRKK